MPAPCRPVRQRHALGILSAARWREFATGVAAQPPSAEARAVSKQFGQPAVHHGQTPRRPAEVADLER